MNLSGVYKSFLERWDGLQTCWIISDTHFGDKDLKQGIHNHPSDEELVKNINAKCGKTDLLIHLGDVGDVSYVKRLRAKRKILIMGNHDAGRSNYEKIIHHERFEIERPREDVIDAMKRLYPNCHYTAVEGYGFHAPFEWWDVYADNCLFDEVYEGPVMIGEKLILSHEPIKNCPWVFNLHGHVHDRRAKNDKYHFNCCLNAINYEPINFNKWMKEGHLAPVETLHRDIINHATDRAKKRGYKYTKYE